MNNIGYWDYTCQSINKSFKHNQYIYEPPFLARVYLGFVNYVMVGVLLTIT
jgi:hypothetical protein